MTRCRRFEEETLLRIEQGLPLDEHFSTCPDCVAARAAYDRLRAELASLGAELEAPERWQAQTWQRIEARRTRRRRWQPWLLVGSLAAAVVAFALLRTPQADLPATLRVEVETGGTQRRGDEAHPGDHLTLQASTGGATHAELRVYRNDRELLLRCSANPPCVRSGRSLSAHLDLDAAGRYQPLLLVGPRAFPAPTGDLDGDTAAAVATGSEVELGHAIVVR